MDSKNEKFIKNAINKHGNKYDYSKVDYISKRDKIIIICPDHGEFSQLPNNHLKNINPCKKCSIEKKRIEYGIDFIKKSKKIHNNKYDYSEVVYIKSSIKVKIICPEHGIFEQKPNNHLNDKGCYYCGREITDNYCRSNNEEFINKSIKIHNDKYDYSKVDYYNWKTKVKIICPEHGVFEQTPNRHLGGNGCKQCKININNKNKHLVSPPKNKPSKPNLPKIKNNIPKKADNIQPKIKPNLYKIKEKDIINNFTKKFKGYTIDIISYKGSESKLKMVHEKCGNSFNLRYGDIYYKNHICDKCHRSENFILKSKIKHNNYYDYSLVDYINSKTDVSIICPKHGEFIQKPLHHVRGSGCFLCSLDKRSKIPWFGFLNRLQNKFDKKWEYSCDDWKGVSKSKINVYCELHGKVPIKSTNLLKLITPCLKCSKISSKSGKDKRSDKEWDDIRKEKIVELKKIHNNKYDYSKLVFRGAEYKVKIICPKHGEFKQLFRSHYYDENGCPICNNSKGENAIHRFLNEKNIKFESQKKFKIIGRKSFDFYLPSYNTCIEYDGKQHFEPIEYFGGGKYFKRQKKSDNIKNKFCNDNNIKLIRIPYWEYDNIEYILDKKIIKNDK